ncbi:hypothetical protein [Azohydromonas lata]|uniref:Uncharacterized protein n=1 Tax=Azohydromonas lata TaxID=45677 RepID=A0ABU5IKW5_9BURK|nr:hypothetical protein [Azohydromonas lata]MDZ5459529.1 hypothetical protein [Azohydromonas lata]
MAQDIQYSMSNEDQRKDEYFQRLAVISEEMVKELGRDFAMGALVLAARYIAERNATPPGAGAAMAAQAHAHASDRPAAAL